MTSGGDGGMLISTPPPTYEASITAPLRLPGAAQARFREVVVNYMRNSEISKLDGSIHPALDNNLDKNALPQQLQFVSITEKSSKLDIYHDVEAEKEEFIKAVNDYNAKAKPKDKLDFRPGDDHSLISLMDSVDSAATEFKERGEQGLWGKIRKSYRQLGQKDAAFHAWLELLPTDSVYFSVVCGGVKLILGAARRTHVIRDEIAEALCEIPSAIHSAQRACRAFDWSDDLRKRMAALWAAIMRTLGQVLIYFKESTWRKLPRAAFLQSNYQRELSQRILTIRHCCEEFTKEANTCSMEVARNTNDGISVVNLKVDRLERQLEQQSQVLQQQSQAMEQMLGLLNAQPDGPILLLRSSSSHSSLQSVAQTPPSSPEFNSKWEKWDKPYSADDTTRSRQLSPLSLDESFRRGRKPRVSTSDLRKSLSRLNFEMQFDSPKHDLKRNLSLAFDLDDDDQDRAVYLMQSNRLTSWLVSIKPSALLVNGNAPVPAGNRGGPLSFVAAKILDSLHKASNKSASGIICLHFFCGEHVDRSEDPDASPAGLMNSLLAQLLNAYPTFDLSAVHNLKNIDTENIEALCKVFAKLVSQLPEETLVFCVIDGLSFYEDKERLNDRDELLENLTALTRKREQGEGGKFKLLLMARNRLYTDCLEIKEVFTLPSVVERGDGFTALKWNLKAGRSFKSLNSRALRS